MKKILSCILSIAFVESQAFAISGGPDYSQVTGHGPSYNDGGTFSTVGTYGGVMVVKSESHPGSNAGSAAAIGLFSLGVPASGIATGTAVVFVDGVAYNGNIIGYADPNTDILDGIVEGTSDYTAQTVTSTGAVESTSIFAQGNLQTQISQPSVPTGEQLLVTSGILIQGTAELDLFSTLNADGTPDVTNSVLFTVDGVQQSSTVTTTTFSFSLNFDRRNDREC